MIRTLLILLLTALPASAETMRMAVTTSFDASGLAEVLLPEIAAETGIEVQLLVVGTGQALRLGEAGDVDAVLVHSRTAEEAFVEAGHATHRREIMYNDFVLIGPTGDPAGIAGAPDAAAALTRIAESRAPFVSRGDDSGTHKAELALWDAAGIAPEGAWYRPTGSGMGAALNTTVAMGAYILSDRATWLNFGNREGMAVLFEGDPALFNQYAYLPMNPARHPHVASGAAMAVEDWLTSEKGQALISGFTIAGERLFTANAMPAAK
ncbi:substrate-binding domain-containing protein [Jannaschia formosa]|uniref:substrate-binding domain-containing protein n=1 Tax=Jannaschia formosa TaxID=2259592 RepID=UPI000E1C26FB|nr:substrate-binding domain-containing protein [Jannaschia formosa]TFL19355.1 sulfate ABC transporter substrate-binding protein [Jannaschia formosa]